MKNRIRNNESAAEIYTNGIHPAVVALDFTRLKWKMSESEEGTMSPEECDAAEQEYKRFLTLKKHYPKISLVPSQQVDKIWHAHILDTAAYRDDCMSVFGYFLDHFPYFGIHGDDDRQNLEDAFRETVRMYETHYGEYPKALKQPARCEDHACHVPSSCACRVPSACK